MTLEGMTLERTASESNGSAEDDIAKIFLETSEIGAQPRVVLKESELRSPARARAPVPTQMYEL